MKVSVKQKTAVAIKKDIDIRHKPSAFLAKPHFSTGVLLCDRLICFPILFE